MSLYLNAHPDIDADEVAWTRTQLDKPVILHFSHSWGGGIDRWISDFALQDKQHLHLTLRSRTSRNAAGVRLELCLSGTRGAILGWDLDEHIPSIASHNPNYAEVISAVVQNFDVRGVVVSSLIGHSLDVFELNIPVLLVIHDLSPFCPALFGFFGKVCVQCDRHDLDACSNSNEHNAFWGRSQSDDWVSLRNKFADLILKENIRTVAPSQDVWARYSTLFPPFAQKGLSKLVPHGLPGDFLESASAWAAGCKVGEATERLRVVIPGRLSPHKGLAIVDSIVGRLAEFADVLLLGSGEFGEVFRGLPHVKVIRDYSRNEIVSHVKEFMPECALLISVLPESFSYTLSEMQALAIPVIATKTGAFVERIRDGVSGLLIDANAEAVLACLGYLFADRSSLSVIRQNLLKLPQQTAADMVAACLEVLGIPEEQEKSNLSELMKRFIFTSAQSGAAWIYCTEQRRKLERGLQAKDEVITSLHGEIEHWKTRSFETESRETVLINELATARVENEAILASTSWRLTAPLRTAVEKVQGLVGRRTDVPPSTNVSECVPESVPALEYRLAFDRQWGFFYGVDESVAALVSKGVVLMTARECERGDGASPGLPRGVSMLLYSSDGTHHRDLAFVLTGMPDVSFAHGCDERMLGVTTAPSLRCENSTYLENVACLSLKPLRLELGMRQDARVRTRDALGLPDATRMMVSCDLTERQLSKAERMASVALASIGVFNDVVFVFWVRDWDRALLSSRLINKAVALRRLFVVTGEVFPWLLASDAYVSTDCEHAIDPFLATTLFYGIPSFVDGTTIVPAVSAGATKRWSATVSGDIQGYLRTLGYEVVDERRVEFWPQFSPDVLLKQLGE